MVNNTLEVLLHRGKCYKIKDGINTISLVCCMTTDTNDNSDILFKLVGQYTDDLFNYILHNKDILVYPKKDHVIKLYSCLTEHAEMRVSNWLLTYLLIALGSKYKY